MITRAIIGSLAALVLLVGQASAAPVRHSEQLVESPSQGNHTLDCTVIRPWTEASGPDDILYPVIAWANGWDQGNVVGEITLEGYKPGLIEWARDGPYIVIAANDPIIVRAAILSYRQSRSGKTSPKSRPSGGQFRPQGRREQTQTRRTS